MKIMIRVIAGIVVAGVCSSLSAAGLSAQSYVQDGLVAQFDAIDNVGTGTHDPSATVWKDLRGNAALTLANGASWDADGRWLDNNVKGQTIVGVPGFDLNSVCTECAVNVLSNGSFNGSSSWPRIFFHTSGDGTYSVYFNTAGTAPEAYVNGSGTRPKFGTFRNGTIALASDTTNVRTYNNGRLNESSSLVIAAGVKATAANWTLGGYSGFLRGLYRAFRHYDRALTANEIAWNALVDQLRFFSYEWKGAASGGTWGGLG